MDKNKGHIISFQNILTALLIWVSICFFYQANATTYLVNTKANLQTKMSAAMPGDTVVVANGTYDWGAINITNNNGSITSEWIVLKSQTFKGVIFTNTTYLEFKGTHIKIDGFYFINGSIGYSPVVQFRNSSGAFSDYSRLTNTIIQDYSSDTATGNNWVSLYGTHNRVDHCTFIHKYNSNPVIVIWYDNNTFPQKSTSTYHLIDSNYFRDMAYQGSNGGEYIRLGTGANCNSDGYNTVEYNLFENGIQQEPEIVSNKSNFNTYRYNTFRNTNGGLTLRRGRYCNVYGNIFIRDSSFNGSRQYGIRIFEKGHNIFNNYFEGINCNQGSFHTGIGPIVINNGESAISDTILLAAESNHFPADSCLIAFNTVVNCYGGAGINIGLNLSNGYPFPAQNIFIANNIIKMLQGTAVYSESTNAALTYIAQGNLYNAASGLYPAGSLAPDSGFTSKTMNFTNRINGLLVPPSLVQDAAINTSNYVALMQSKDIRLTNRSAIFDVGCYELNSTGTIVNTPLDSNVVGAGKPVVTLPVELINFNAELINKSTVLSWKTGNEINVNNYTIQASIDAFHFKEIGTIIASNKKQYYFTDANPANGLNYYQLKIKDDNGSYKLSEVNSVSLLNNEERFTLFPNPAQQFFTVSFKQNSYTNIEIVIADITGRIIKTTKVFSPVTNINLQNVEKGIYIIQVKENNQIIYTQKQIVIK